MKTLKFLLPVAALFVSAIAFGQKGNNKAQSRTDGSTKVHTRTKQSTTSDRRDEARMNGTITSNTHASERAKSRANENAAFDGSGTYTKTKANRSSGDKRKYGKKKS